MNCDKFQKNETPKCMDQPNCEGVNLGGCFDNNTTDLHESTIKTPKSFRKSKPLSNQVITHPKFRFRKKMAAFDYDHTLVKPVEGAVFSQKVDDWQWLRYSVKKVLIEYYQRGYSIVIFTNQSRKFKTEQIRLVLDTLDIPYKAYIQYNKSEKKPNSKVFSEFSQSRVDIAKSFYVGDALGRTGDWSDSDKVFAINCGLRCYSPEEMFPFKIRTHKPVKNLDNQEVIIMVGYPGSGKSTFIKKNFNTGYVVLSGDDLKTESKMKKGLRATIANKLSAVLDATHGSIKKRKIFIDIAKEAGLPVRVIHITTSIEESMNQNNNRDIKVPKIAFWVYRKHFQEPTLGEGINEVIKF